MAVEILSRQTSPVDGLLTLLKNWNLCSVSWHFGIYVRGEHFYHLPIQTSDSSRWFSWFQHWGFRPAVRISALLQIACLAARFKSNSRWRFQHTQLVILTFARAILTLLELRSFSWICRPKIWNWHRIQGLIDLFKIRFISLRIIIVYWKLGLGPGPSLIYDIL